MTAAAGIDRENYADVGVLEPEDQPGARTVLLTRASEIAPRPVLWLWLLRLALGAFNLLGGREGIGKSIVGYTWRPTSPLVDSLASTPASRSPS